MLMGSRLCGLTVLTIIGLLSVFGEVWIIEVNKWVGSPAISPQSATAESKPISPPATNAVPHLEKKRAHTINTTNLSPEATAKAHGFPAFTRGEWVFREAAARPITRCCSNHYGSETECFQGVPGAENLELLIPEGNSGWCSCSNNNNHEEPKQDKPGGWVWEPTRVEEIKPVWDAKLFCELLDGRNLYMLGDSTMGQTWTALANRVVNGRGGCMGQLKLWLSDLLVPFTLSKFTIPERDHSASSYLDKLFSPSSNERAIVLVNEGAHTNDDPDYNRVIAWLEKYMDAHAGVIVKPDDMHIENDNNKRVRVLWKTNNPMHETCKVQPAIPARSNKLADAKGELHQNRLQTWGHHSKVGRRDREATEKFLRVMTGVIDMTPLYMRHDGHTKDCFHYCWNKYLGSPIDYVADALLDSLVNPTKRIT